MKITCPRCNGEKFLHDLTRIQSDLDYPNGRLRQESEYPFGGFPALACDVCKGQGWVGLDSYLGRWYMLHLDSSGFWVFVDLPIQPREAMFHQDLASGFFVVDTSGISDGTRDAVVSNGFITLS